MKHAAALLSALLVLASGTTWAGNVNMREGLWEITSSTDAGAIPGMPKGMKMPAVVIKHCYTATDVQGNKALMDKGNCALISMKQTGNGASWVSECKGEQAMRMEGEGTFSGDAYQIKSRMTFLSGQMKGQTMGSTISARRLGDCKK
jgi:hypothetical protein